MSTIDGFGDQRGLSLLEVVVAMAVLLLVLPGMFMVFAYGTQAFQTGEAQADLQQNLRLIAGHVRDELRYADVLELIEESDMEAKLANNSFDTDFRYIYSQDGQVMQTFEGEDGQWVRQKLFEDISSQVDIALHFSSEADSLESLLNFSVTGTRQERDAVFDSQVRLFNVDIPSSAEGVAVKYQQPAPPPAAIRDIEVLDSDPVTNESEQRRSHYESQEVSVYVRVTTVNIVGEDGAAAELHVVDPAGGDDWFVFHEGICDDNPAVFELNFHGDEMAGAYRFRAKVQLGEESVEMSTLYLIIPVLEALSVEGHQVDLQLEETEYEAVVPSTAESVGVVASLYDAGGTLTVDGALTGSGEEREVTLDLEGEGTEIPIEVISVEQGIVNEYSLTVYRSASVSPTQLTYDVSDSGDVTTHIEWNGADEVKEVIGEEIEEGQWYVDGDTLTITETFLSQFDAGRQLNLTIRFDVGEDASLQIEVTDSGN